MLVANEYFRMDVTFIRQGNQSSTPDLDVNGEKWEIKSPLGKGKKTIENNLRAARKQFGSIILDFSCIKLHQTKAIANMEYYLEHSSPKFKKVIVITKDKRILEIL